MMKRLIFPIILLAVTACFHVLPAQNLLDQAKQLRPFFKPVPEAPGLYFSVSSEDSLKMLTGMLASMLQMDGEVRLQDLLDQLADNPYIGREINPAKLIIDDSRQSSILALATSKKKGPGPSQTSPFSVSTIADGIAKFLVTRAKQELSIAFFEKFQERMRNDRRLTTIFPETANTLSAVGEKIYQADNYINDLRQAFDKDMRVLPGNFKIYCRNEQFFSDSTSLGILVEDLLDLSQKVIDKTPPDGIITFMASETALQQSERLNLISNETTRKQLHNVAAGLKITDLVSQSLRSSKEGEIWISRSELDKGVFDEGTFFIYLGLLHHRGKDIAFSDGHTFGQLLGSIKKADDLRSTFRRFCSYGEQLQESIAMQKEDVSAGIDSASGAMRYEPYYLFANGLTGLLETALSIKTQSDSVRGVYSHTDTVFIQGLRHLNDLNFNIRQRLYASAINDLIQTLTLVLPANDDTRVFLENVSKYGRFIANVAEARNSDEVAAAIESIALPVGSSRLKKMSAFSVTLNAYTGGSYGKEILRTTERSSTLAAISAPVGIAFSIGKNGRSYSLFVPVIDVGALAAFRLQDPDAEQLPELEWRNLFAPGGYFLWGFSKKLPFTVGVGAQYGPGLRKVTVDMNTIEDSAWRYGLMLNVDIPVFNLFSR